MNRPFHTATDIDVSPEMPGYLEYQAREAFADLMRVYGFEQARAIMAEIINIEAGERYKK